MTLTVVFTHLSAPGIQVHFENSLSISVKSVLSIFILMAKKKNKKNQHPILYFNKPEFPFQDNILTKVSGFMYFLAATVPLYRLLLLVWLSIAISITFQSAYKGSHRSDTDSFPSPHLLKKTAHRLRVAHLGGNTHYKGRSKSSDLGTLLDN